MQWRQCEQSPRIRCLATSPTVIMSPELGRAQHWLRRALYLQKVRYRSRNRQAIGALFLHHRTQEHPFQ
jgi:hypothetical protein